MASCLPGRRRQRMAWRCRHCPGIVVRWRPGILWQAAGVLIRKVSGLRSHSAFLNCCVRELSAVRPKARVNWPPASFFVVRNSSWDESPGRVARGPAADRGERRRQFLWRGDRPASRCARGRDSIGKTSGLQRIGRIYSTHAPNPIAHFRGFTSRCRDQFRRRDPRDARLYGEPQLAS